eukprot:jgi/Bigna1/128244/aug1.6_g2952
MMMMRQTMALANPFRILFHSSANPEVEFGEASLSIVLCIFNLFLDKSLGNVRNSTTTTTTTTSTKTTQPPAAASVADANQVVLSKKEAKAAVSTAATKHAEDADRKDGTNDDEANSKLLSMSDIDTMLAFSVSLLNIPLVGPLLPLMEILSKLTKSWRNAVYFVKKGGLRQLLNIKSMPGIEAGLVLTCQTILRHAVEHPAVLQQSMQREIFVYVAEHSKQQGSSRSSSSKRELNLHELVTRLGTIVSRDPPIFLKALRSICRFDAHEDNKAVTVSLKTQKLKFDYELEKKDEAFISRYLNSFMHSVMMDYMNDTTTKAEDDVKGEEGGGVIIPAAVAAATTKKASSSSESKTRKKATAAKKSGEDDTKEDGKSSPPSTESKGERGLGYKPLLRGKSMFDFLRNLVETHHPISNNIVKFQYESATKSSKREAKTKSFVSYAVGTMFEGCSSTLLTTLCCRNPSKAAPIVINAMVEWIRFALAEPNKPPPDLAIDNLLFLLGLFKNLLHRSSLRRKFVTLMVKSRLLDVLAILMNWMTDHGSGSSSSSSSSRRRSSKSVGSSMLRAYFQILDTILREDERKPLKLDDTPDPEAAEYITAEERYGSERSSSSSLNPFARMFSSGPRYLIEAIRRRAVIRRPGEMQLVLQNALVDGPLIILQNQFGGADEHGHPNLEEEEEEEEEEEDHELMGDDANMLMNDEMDHEHGEDGLWGDQSDLEDHDDELAEDDFGEEDEDDDDDGPEDMEDDMSEVRVEDDEDIASETVEERWRREEAEEDAAAVGAIDIRIMSDDGIEGEEDEDDDEDNNGNDGDDDINEDEAQQILLAEEESKLTEEGQNDDEQEEDEVDNSPQDLLEDIDEIVGDDDDDDDEDGNPFNSDFLREGGQPLQYDDGEADQAASSATRIPQHFYRIFEHKYDMYESKIQSGPAMRWYEFGEASHGRNMELRKLIKRIVSEVREETQKKRQREKSKEKKSTDGDSKGKEKGNAPTAMSGNSSAAASQVTTAQSESSDSKKAAAAAAERKENGEEGKGGGVAEMVVETTQTATNAAAQPMPSGKIRVSPPFLC